MCSLFRISSPRSFHIPFTDQNRRPTDNNYYDHLTRAKVVEIRDWACDTLWKTTSLLCSPSSLSPRLPSSLTHSLTYLLIHSLTHSLTFSVSGSLHYSFPIPFVCKVTLLYSCYFGRACLCVYVCVCVCVCVFMYVCLCRSTPTLETKEHV